jgi:hypothetical protein
MAITTDAHAPLPAPEARTQLRRHFEARLSGAVVEGAECNPVDMSVSTFSQVSQFDFEEESNVTVVNFVQVPDDVEDW